MHPLVEYVEHVDVWAATIEDKPGQLAHLLTELREAGADCNRHLPAGGTRQGGGVRHAAPGRQGNRRGRAGGF